MTPGSSKAATGVDVNEMDAGGSAGSMCDEVLASHSEYLDGLLPPHEAARLQWHLASCGSCARYDRIVRRSGELCRDLPEIAPSEDFADRLKHRIYHIDEGTAASPRAGGALATVAVAGVIALLAWSPVYLGTDTEADDAVVVLEQEPPQPRQAPFIPAPALLGNPGEVWLTTPSPTPLANGSPINVLAKFPGPHSRLIVNPPVHRAARAVSAEPLVYE